MTRMNNSLKAHTYALLYGALITKILEHFKFKLNGPLVKPRAQSQIGTKTLNQMGAKVIDDNVIFWEGMKVTGPNFSPLPFDPYVSPSTSDNEAPNSPAASLNRVHSSSKFLLKEMVYDLIGCVCHNSNQVRKARMEIREVKARLGNTIEGNLNDEPDFKKNGYVFAKYYGSGDDDGNGGGGGVGTSAS